MSHSVRDLLDGAHWDLPPGPAIWTPPERQPAHDCEHPQEFDLTLVGDPVRVLACVSCGRQRFVEHVVKEG